MSFGRLLLTRLLGFALISSSTATFFYPNPQAALLEHILVDTHGAHASGFANAITPCSNYVSGVQTLGRETAAQWLRVSFHDFVTANVTEGTGGIDASIGFETLRDENSGSAMNDSLGFFRPYVSSKISMADLIALSVSMSVGNCGGPQIPVRGGRIDATEAGISGVPAPETDLATTLEYFSRAGFDAVDSIGLTACGHTMGSVHHGGFPTVVGPEAVTPNNTAGGIHFDSTVDIFDPLVVHEYLNGTGNQGGPLVTSFNVSSRSDLRLYESDNNTTMIGLAAQGSGFLQTCSVLLQRMIETVPRGVVLSDVIKPTNLKPVNATLDIIAGDLLFTGLIRILTPLSSNTPSSINLAISNERPVALRPEPTAGTSIFGISSFFPFSISVSNPKSVSTFTVRVNNLEHIFPLQVNGFVVPSMTSILSTNVSSIVNFAVAVLAPTAFGRRITPLVTIKAPVGQIGTFAPAIQVFEIIAVTYMRFEAGYNLWTGSLDLGTLATGPIEVALVGNGGQEVDIAFF